MKTLVTAIQKGGQGKTCITCHLAFDFHQHRKQRVAVIDLDTQENASFTLAGHESALTASLLFEENPEKLRRLLSEALPLTQIEGEGGLTLFKADAPAMMSLMEKKSWIELAKALHQSIGILAEYFDVCLIDTPPSQGPMLAGSALVADYLLSPIELETYSLMGVQKMSDFVQQAKKTNPKLRFLGMLPNKLDSRKKMQAASLAMLRQRFPEQVLPVSISNRASIAAALSKKIPVWKIRNAAAREAAKEVRAVANHLFEQMGLEAK